MSHKAHVFINGVLVETIRFWAVAESSVERDSLRRSRREKGRAVKERDLLAPTQGWVASEDVVSSSDTCIGCFSLRRQIHTVSPACLAFRFKAKI